MNINFNWLRQEMVKAQKTVINKVPEFLQENINPTNGIALDNVLSNINLGWIPLDQATQLADAVHTLFHIIH
jgi:hypothetical protein